MALTTGEMSAADLAAIVGGENNDGFGNGNGWWIILFFLLCMNGGWGNGWGGNGNSGGALYPWMNQAELTNGGFRDQMINSNITGIRDGIYGISAQLCNGFAGVEQGANARQMADMNQNFGMQTAIMQGFNGMQSQFADCCCENRLGLADLKYTVATENCADRAAFSDGIRDVIASNTAQTQAILDKLCQLELDGLKQDNANLRTQLNMANLAASQTAQTAELRTAQATTANQLISELRSCPIPAQPVYGSQPIFTCNGNGGCGCGM